MAKAASTTRRALFAAAPAIALSSAASGAATLDPTESQIIGWANAAERYRHEANTCPIDGEAAQANYKRLYDLFCEYEERVLRAPCLSRRVAVAQLKMGALESLEDGERADGLDVESLKKVIAFLGAH